ncbi:MAG: cation acetate symporter [Planctomycetaceae bacterium]|nr:cation acetate symporter [Planctomycetaceae bacterium]MBP60622.1 cation acetate symporter [Planctomycetaceae bacterium]
MIYEATFEAVAVFAVFVAITLALSFYLGGRAKSSKGYFTAHGEIPWFVNGIAFAGDYLSAASFLGICGMIAFYGYDGFLYSIGYLAGWIVALFVVAEPMKRLGKFTFADALDAKFNSRGIKLAAGISTLAVSIFYLIPQMVGAGVLIQPLLGFEHWHGVVIVGTVVIIIVVSAGMVSTTWVQFLKGSLLVIFSAVLTVMILVRGFETSPGGGDRHVFASAGPVGGRLFSTENVKQHEESGHWPEVPVVRLEDPATNSTSVWRVELADIQQLPPFHESTVLPPEGNWRNKPFVRIQNNATGATTVWSIAGSQGDALMIHEAQLRTITSEGKELVNGVLKGDEKGEPELHPVGTVTRLPDGKDKTGPLGPLEFFRTLQNSDVALWGSTTISDSGGESTVYFQKPTPGSHVLRPGEHPRFAGIRKKEPVEKLNFLSLMLALFCGTASLPHILIRYYTVKDAQSARKSTIVGIGSIGFFYILTLYLGLGAMTSGSLDVTNSNMAAPLLAKSMNEWLFAIISAIAFTTVLGTVSGLILASAGAVSHDLIQSVLKIELDDRQQVRVAKIASVVVGGVAILLGILFQDLNVSYLVGWAFSVAASANLPALVTILFWKGVTRQGVIAGVTVGMTSSLAWILLSADTFTKVYGLSADSAIVPFSQPGIVTIPLGFVTLIVVSLLTRQPSRADG